MFEDDSLFSQCLEQPLNSGWQKTGNDWLLTFDRTPYAREDLRPFLILESVPSEAQAIFNEKNLGVMQPFLPYRLEVTDLLQAEKNTLLLRFSNDAASRPPLNAYLDYKKPNVILDAAFSASFLPDGSAACTVDVKCDLKEEGLHVQLFLMDPLGNIVHDANFPAETRVCHAFTLQKPMLWDTKCPNLYSLNISLERNGMLCDMYAHGRSGKVGFKRLEKGKNGLLLNGLPFRERSVHLPSDLSEVDLSSLKNEGVRLIFCTRPSFALLEEADASGILVAARPQPQDASVLSLTNHVSLLILPG